MTLTFILFLFYAIKSQNIEWFKTTSIHQDNIQQLISNWSQCLDWDSMITSIYDNLLYNITALCNTIQVPLNWDDNRTDNNTTINYHFARIFSGFDPNNTRGNGAFWMLQGGPGAAGSTLYRLTIPFLNFLDDTLDLYIPDHRGTGYSNLLSCNSSSIEACAKYLNETYNDDTLYFSTYQASMDLGYAVDLFQTNLSVYNNTNDIIYGVSYGTYYLNQYLTLFPDQFNASIFDSIAAPDFKFSQFNNGSNMAGLEFLNRCNENTFCHDRFEELNTTILNATERIFDELKSNITNELYCVNGLRLLLGDSAASLTRTVLYGLLMNSDRRVLIPPIIYRLYRCNEDDAEVFVNLLKLLNSTGSFNQTTNITSTRFGPGLYYNIVFSEMWNPPNASDPGPSVDELEADEDGYYFSSGGIAVLRAGWDVWNRYKPNPIVYNQYADPPIPMLLIHGDLDPQTHITSGVRAAEQYGATNIDGNRYFYILPNAPHGIIIQTPIDNYTDTTLWLDHDYETCGMYIMKTFINANNGYVPDADCIAWLSDIDWNATSNISKQIGTALLGTSDVWGVQSIELPSLEPTRSPLAGNKSYAPTEKPTVAKTWFITGIVFIVLFGISLIVMCYLGFRIYTAETKKVNDSYGNYNKANNRDVVEVGTLKNTVAEDY